MATTSLQQFCPTDTGTNLETDSVYTADTNRITGNKPGIASAKVNNKALRQASLIATAVAQYLAAYQATNIDDTLTPAQVKTAMDAAFSGGVVSFSQVAATATLTIPTRATKAWIRLWGAGGGGGGMGNAGAGGGGGGGGGGYCEGLVTGLIPGNTVTVTIAPGPAGGALGGNNGISGGSSSFGAFATALGGFGGSGFVSGTGGGGNGGTATMSGGTGLTGSQGQNGIQISAIYLGGVGGGSVMGASNTYNSAGGGSAGNFPGGGGGGGGQNTPGGVGAGGFCEILWLI